VATSSGLDILSHAVESFHGAAVFGSADACAASGAAGVSGLESISDVWSLQALRMVAKYLVRAVEDPGER